NDKKTRKHFICNILKQFRANRLANYITLKIVQHYRNDDPTKQSIWNTDASRYIYAVMEDITNQNDGENKKWVVDKKGKRTIELMVEPLLKHINQMLIDRNIQLNNKVQRYTQ